MAAPSTSHRDARDSSHRRSTTTTSSPFNHSRRSWTDNGIHYNVETASFASPSIAFGSVSGSARSPFDTFFATQPNYQPSRAQRQSSNSAGVLGGAFNLLDGWLSMQQQHAAMLDNMHQRPSHQPRMEEEEESEGEDDDDDEEEDDALAYGPSIPPTGRPRTVLSKLRDRLLEASRQRTRQASHTRELPSELNQDRGLPRDRRPPRNFRTEVRQPSWAQARHFPAEEDVYEQDGTNTRQQRPAYNRAAYSQAEMIEALERAVEHETKEYSRAKKRFQQASQRTMINSAWMQDLLNDMKTHEKAMKDATRALEKARDRARRPDAERRPKQSARPSTSRQSSARVAVEDPLAAWMAGGFGSFFQHPRRTHTDPIFQAFEDFGAFDPFARTGFGAFDRLFTGPHAAFVADDDEEDEMRFFAPGTSSNKRPRFTTNNSRAYTTYDATPQSHVQLQRPPANVLKPEEAKQLFKAYCDRWAVLAPTDPNIPYPARSLIASNLVKRDTIWAPLVTSPISTWSEEAVMQANTQAFFLLAFGLSPTYTEPGSRIEMGFDKRAATPEQVKALIDVLKKEKIRWHSDRLGRRTGGMSGPNEALQRDERARAVFHAVCGLMETAQAA